MVDKVGQFWVVLLLADVLDRSKDILLMHLLLMPLFARQTRAD